MCAAQSVRPIEILLVEDNQDAGGFQPRIERALIMYLQKFH